MRLGIDCRQIYDVGKNSGAGIPRYIFNLVKNILPLVSTEQIVLFVNQNLSPETIRALETCGPVEIIKVHEGYPRGLSHIVFPFVIRRARVDRMIFPTGIQPLLYFGHSIVVVHDLAIYKHPEWFPGGQWFSTRVLVPRSLQRAEKIITVSETTRADLLELFPSVDPKIVQTVCPGVAMPPQYDDSRIIELKEKFNIRKPFLLFVGTLEPRKNIVNIIRSFMASRVDAELLLAGCYGWKSAEIVAEIAAGHPAVRYLGTITDEERNILMKLSNGFIFPSYYEGFGLPVVEALLSGTRTIVSTVPVFRELFHSEVEFVAPESLSDLSLAIKKVLSSERLDLTLTTAVAQRFNPRTAAMKFLGVIKN